MNVTHGVLEEAHYALRTTIQEMVNTAVWEAGETNALVVPFEHLVHSSREFDETVRGMYEFLGNDGAGLRSLLESAKKLDLNRGNRPAAGEEHVSIAYAIKHEAQAALQALPSDVLTALQTAQSRLGYAVWHPPS